MPLQLVRFGIFKGSGAKLFHSARFHKEFEVLSGSELAGLHKQVCNLFRALPYGPFQAACEMAGEVQAREWASSGVRECVLPPSHQNPSMSESSKPNARSSTLPKFKKRARLDQGSQMGYDREVSD